MQNFVPIFSYITARVEADRKKAGQQKCGSGKNKL